jgi:hypothetical protein
MGTETLDLSSNNNDLKTLSSCLNSLLAAGFETQFKAVKEGLKSLTTEKVYKPEEIQIKNFYRFEGESDPADSSILYAIQTNSGERGTLTDAYGAYSDAYVTKFIQDVEAIHKREHNKNA